MRSRNLAAILIEEREHPGNTGLSAAAVVMNTISAAEQFLETTAVEQRVRAKIHREAGEFSWLSTAYLWITRKTCS